MFDIVTFIKTKIITMKKLILILLFIPLVSFSQEDIKKCKNEINFGTAKYIGCIDVEGKALGWGVMTFDSGDIYEGNWVNNNMDGFGKLTSADGGTYEGNWVNDMRNGVGESSSKTNNQKSIAKGVFKNNIFFSGQSETEFVGQGVFQNRVYLNGEITETLQKNLDNMGNIEYTAETIGSHFSNGSIKSGYRTITRQNGNLIITSSFENGDEIIGSEKSNIKNYYVKEDVIGGLDVVKINLETEPNDNTKYVNLKIATKTPLGSFRFVFDTGAEYISIGYNLFKKLKENGLEYEDMNVTVKSIGVSGVPINNKVIRLKELTIGEYKVMNVIALIKTLETANTSLLGIGFMRKFKDVSWSLSSNVLTFEK